MRERIIIHICFLSCIIHLNTAIIDNPFNVLCFPWTFYNMTSGLLCYFVEHQRIRNFHYRNLHSKIKRNRSNNIITYIPWESRYKKILHIASNGLYNAYFEPSLVMLKYIQIFKISYFYAYIKTVTAFMQILNERKKS